MRRLGLWGPPTLCMAVIFLISSQPAPLPEVTERVWDKLLHAVEFGVLGILMYRAFAGEGAGWLVAALLALVATTAYAASDEWHQTFVPLREAGIDDWTADTIGAAIAVSLCVIVSRDRDKRVRLTAVKNGRV